MGVSSAPTDGQTLRKGIPPAASRPLREDHHLRTSLDKLFSDWKVLVGPNDWRNHYKGLEGAAKYRLHNLPNCFHSGVYELAVYLDKSTHAHDTRKGTSNRLNKDALVPVYVGQAENVRDRLQEYGRCGSHLEGSLQNGKCQQCETRTSQTNTGFIERIVVTAGYFEEGFCPLPHLFTRAFDRAYSIAFRWTATKCKVDAAALEAFLLQSYDYAWNRGSNGERRPEDAFRKLQHISKTRSWGDFSKWMKLPKIGGPSKVRNLLEKRIDISEVLWMLDNPATRLSVAAASIGGNSEFLSIFGRRKVKEEKGLPLICTKKHDRHSQSETLTCGIIDGSGSLCNNIPLPGRKRCKAHKGMRLRAADKPTMTKTHSVSGPSETGVCKWVDGGGMDDKPTLVSRRYVVVQAAASELTQQGSLSLVCGYISKDGLTCMESPEKGRRRCTSHKGRRIRVQS